MSRSVINILVEDDRWEVVDGFAAWTRLISNLPEFITKKLNMKADCVMNLLLIDNDAIKELNGVHRGKSECTNVLSFPQYNAGELAELDAACRGVIQLGDVAMSFEKIEQESTEFGMTFFERSTHMLVHGTLHLVGMDHEDDTLANRMEAAEAEVLDSLRLMRSLYPLSGVEKT
jgi:probable rRNA maturation factor